MIVGIVSKEAHAKNHAASLAHDGHTVHLLGSDPDIDFPDNLDVLILRHLSSSHGALERARAHAKARKIPMVAENGLSGIRMALAAMNNKFFQDVTLASPSKPAAAEAQPPVEVDEDAALVEALKKSAPSSFIRQVLAPYAKTPARFMRRCFSALEAKGVGTPAPDLFKQLWVQVFPKENYDDTLMSWFYKAGNTFRSIPQSMRDAVVDAFMAADAGHGHSFFPSPMPTFISELKGQNRAFLCFYMWALLDKRPKRTSIITYAYRELTGGKQVDPKAYPFYRDAIGFEVTLTRPGDGSDGSDAVVEAPVVVETAPVASSTSEPAVLKTVQDEILNLAIRLEESEKLSREVKTLSEILTDTTRAIARIEAGLGDTNVALTMQEQKQSESCRDQQFLSGELSDIQTEMQAQSRRIEEYAQSLTQTVNARLGEIQNMLMDSVLVAVQQEIKSVLAQTPSPSGSIEDTLRTLKALGAEVTIHIPR